MEERKIIYKMFEKKLGENFTSGYLHQLGMHTAIKHEYQDFFILVNNQAWSPE